MNKATKKRKLQYYTLSNEIEEKFEKYVEENFIDKLKKKNNINTND